MGLSMKQVSLDDLFDNWLQPSESPRPPQSNNKRPRQVLQQPEPLNCPRCNSTNTKFCYYNNYNRTQPRHFCKSCKRHWTKGGTLRNVPVGGGRKNKRHKPSQPAANITPTLSSLNQTTDNYVHHQQLSFLDLDDNALIGDTKTLMNQPMQFLFSGSNFESSRSSNVTNNIATASFQKQENMEKSVIECIVQGNINYEAWELEVGDSTNFSVMELPSRSYWNWNDFDPTVSDFSIPNWDETDIKP